MCWNEITNREIAEMPLLSVFQRLLYNGILLWKRERREDALRGRKLKDIYLFPWLFCGKKYTSFILGLAVHFVLGVAENYPFLLISQHWCLITYHVVGHECWAVHSGIIIAWTIRWSGQPGKNYKMRFCFFAFWIGYKNSLIPEFRCKFILTSA